MLAFWLNANLLKSKPLSETTSIPVCLTWKHLSDQCVKPLTLHHVINGEVPICILCPRVQKEEMLSKALTLIHSGLLPFS